MDAHSCTFKLQCVFCSTVAYFILTSKKNIVKMLFELLGIKRIGHPAVAVASHLLKVCEDINEMFY